MSDTKAYPPWRPAVNGSGQHPWFLMRGDERTVPLDDRYLLRADGQTRRFESMESAQKYADKINANVKLTTAANNDGDLSGETIWEIRQTKHGLSLLFKGQLVASSNAENLPGLLQMIDISPETIALHGLDVVPSWD